MCLFGNLVVILVSLNKVQKIVRRTCCWKDVAMLLKIVKNGAARHFLRMQVVKMKFWKVVYLYKALENDFNQFSRCSSKACKGMVYWLYRKCCEIKRTVTFESLVEHEWNFAGIRVFMRVLMYYESSMIVLIN